MFMTPDIKEHPKFMEGNDEHNFGHGLPESRVEERERLLTEVDMERSAKG